MQKAVLEHKSKRLENFMEMLDGIREIKSNSYQEIFRIRVKEVFDIRLMKLVRGKFYK